MGVRAQVDKQSCQSSGRCVAAAPGLFRLDGDYLAEARPDASQLPLERLREVARGCPATAIELFNDEGSELDF